VTALSDSSCIGDPCFRKRPSICNYGFDTLTQIPYLYPNGTCSCNCTDPTFVYRPAVGAGGSGICLAPDNICESNADCGYPVRGSCNSDLKYCKCLTPWAGSNCTVSTLNTSRLVVTRPCLLTASSCAQINVHNV
jgi:hypothetical protein